MARKKCLENFYEKVSETLNGDNSVKGYDCLWDLVFNFEEALASFKIKHLIKLSS